MPTKFSPEDLQRIKQAVDMVKYLEEKGVHLTPSGVSLKGLCPIHNERSPSFHVKTREMTGNLDTFHCYGCGEGGDIIELVRFVETVSFPGAVLFLAERAGIELTQHEDDPDYKRKQRLYAVCKEAASWFHTNFLDLPEAHPAKQNLLKRQLLYPNMAGYGALTDPIVGWTDRGKLIPMLQEKGFSRQEIRDAGFEIENERGWRETFINRLIWTVQDTAGRAIGFSGRKVLPEDEANERAPKYVNSPQTLLYNKSSALLGLAEAKSVVSKSQEVIIVEGNADLLAFRAAGQMNTVSTCGTAFGDQHTQILTRLSAAGRDAERFQIVLCFDGDKAGIKAAKNVFERQKSVQRNSYVVVLPNGEDPAEYRLSAGDDALRTAVAKRIPLVEFILQQELHTWDVKTPEGLVSFLQSARGILALVANDTQREAYFRLLSFWTGASMDQVRSAVGRAQRDTGEPETQVTMDQSLQARVLAAAVQHPRVFAQVMTTRSLTPDMFPDFELSPRILAGDDDLSNKAEVIKLMHLDLRLDRRRLDESIAALIASYQRALYQDEVRRINQTFIATATDDTERLFEMMQLQHAAREKYQVRG